MWTDGSDRCVSCRSFLNEGMGQSEGAGQGAVMAYHQMIEADASMQHASNRRQAGADLDSEILGPLSRNADHAAHGGLLVS